MAPIRRYLRITKYSVLECRIYLDNPALAQSWLLHPARPVLPRVIESVRPLVLPKLREEKERARKKKSTKKKGIKDTVVEDDFEVAIFLTETSTRHSILYKHRHFRDKTQTKLVSNNANRLTGASAEAPIDVDDRGLTVELPEDAAAHEDDEEVQEIPAHLLREDSDEVDAAALLADIPSIHDVEDAEPETAARRSKRRRSEAVDYADEGGMDQDEEDSGSDFDIPDEEVDVDAIREVDSMPPPKRMKGSAGPGADEDGLGNDKKKKNFDISYEGFAIYGRVLCLVVKKRDGTAAAASAGGATGKKPASGPKSKAGGVASGGQGMMEDWITSTQMPAVIPDETDAP